MRAWVSLVAAIAALACAAPAFADTPASVYSDYASDGQLSCGHSRAALNGVLNDASIYQYGDPLTLLQLKLEIRRQLAGGCKASSGATAANGSAGTVPPSDGSGDSGAHAGATAPSRQRDKMRPRTSTRKTTSAPSTSRPLASGAASGHEDGRMVLLGVALLLVALGAGGWAARRAFNGRQ